MGRHKGRVYRGGGLSKRDTPARVTETRQRIRRLQLRNVYKALPEERIVSPAEPGSPVTINVQPVNSKTVLSVRDEIQPDVFASITAKKKPARPPVLPISEPGPFQTHNEIAPIVKEPDGRNSTATPETEMTFSVEADTTFNSDDDDDDDDDNEDCYSSSNTLSSPEIFRGEGDAEPETSCVKARHMSLHPIITNSTLLDMSCAQSIYMHQPPDLSAINNASSVLAEMCQISNSRRPEGDSQTNEISFKSDSDINFKTSAKRTMKKPLLCKKVVFKSPIMTEHLYLEVKHSPASKCSARYGTDPVQTLSPADQVEPAEKASIPGKMSSEEDALLSDVKLKRSVGGAEKAKFFDLVSDADKDLFFQMARERSVKLKSAPLFPLSAAKHAPSVL